MSEELWSECRSCERSTKHTVISEKSIEELPEVYHAATKFRFVECNGCGTLSLREEFHDYENYFTDDEGNYDHPVTIRVYPEKLVEHGSIAETEHIPSIVLQIYQETLLAIRAGALILAGLGLRAVVEAICNDKNVKGRDLSVKINNMLKAGIVSKADANRLHGIRFMGNDSAHELKRPKKSSIFVALQIVEHVIQSVYVFESSVGANLETPLETAEDVTAVLNSRIPDIAEGTIFTFNNWLGKDRRRIVDNFSDIENQILSKVSACEFVSIQSSAAPPGDGSDSKTNWFIKTTPADAT